MKTLDDDIRDSLRAAVDTVPDGYFDELPGRIQAQLEVHAMRDVSMASGSKGTGDLPPPGAMRSKPQDRDEDSGLIDIKQMARSTKERVSQRVSTESDVEESLLASSRPSALRDVVLPEPGQDRTRLVTEDDLAAPAAASDSGPAAPARRGGWLAAAAALVLIGGGAAAFFATRGGDSTAQQPADKQVVVRAEVEPAVAQPPAPPPVTEPAPAEDPAPAAVDDDDSEGDALVAEAIEPEPALTGDKAEKPADRPARPRGKDRGEVAKADTKKAGEPKDEPKKDEPKADAPRAGGGLDSLLDEAAGVEESDKPVEEKPAADKVATKKKLERSDIKDGMKSILPRVSACYDQYKVPGTVSVKVSIANTGVVTQATATGKFANTETGACVAKAVSQATFPEWDGPPMSISYPFLLQ